MQESVCRKCSIPLSEDNWYSHHARNRRFICSACHLKQHKNWRVANPEAMKRIVTKSNKKRYKITPEAYDALLASYNGVCPLCHTPDRKLVLDHNHKTGIVRGGLCQGCNTLLGHIEVRNISLTELASYLNK